MEQFQIAEPSLLDPILESMLQNQLKHPRDIGIRVTLQRVEDGLLSAIKTTAEIPLSDKLNDLLMRLGYSSAHITGIIVQLLNRGKVQIDFRDCTERLELVEKEDQLSPILAMATLNNYILEMRTPDEARVMNKTTQCIVVQPHLLAKRR
jgi:hypothetical protein